MKTAVGMKLLGQIESVKPSITRNADLHRLSSHQLFGECECDCGMQSKVSGCP